MATSDVAGEPMRLPKHAVLLSDRSTLAMDREQTREADLRLAYVQHPASALGVTADNPPDRRRSCDRQGTYVAVTSAATESTSASASEVVEEYRA